MDKKPIIETHSAVTIQLDKSKSSPGKTVYKTTFEMIDKAPSSASAKAATESSPIGNPFADADLQRTSERLDMLLDRSSNTERAAHLRSLADLVEKGEASCAVLALRHPDLHHTWGVMYKSAEERRWLYETLPQLVEILRPPTGSDAGSRVDDKTQDPS